MLLQETNIIIQFQKKSPKNIWKNYFCITKRKYIYTSKNNEKVKLPCEPKRGTKLRK